MAYPLLAGDGIRYHAWLLSSKGPATGRQEAVQTVADDR